MLGKLQHQKIERLFNVLDSNKDALLEAADFSQVAERLAQVRNVDTTSVVYEKILAMQMGWWEGIRQGADKDSDGQITLDEWNTFWAAWLDSVVDEIGSGQSPALDAIKASASSTFDVIDTNGDGQITPTEYADWCKAMSLNIDAQATFERLDVSQVGKMSRDQTVERIKEYFLTNDPEAPGNHIYGPLN